MEINSETDLISKLAERGIKQLLPPETIIYKYVSFETAQKIIEANSLLFSPPTAFNDPFDLTNSLVDKSFTEFDLRNWLDRVSDDPITKQKIFDSNHNNSWLFN